MIDLLCYFFQIYYNANVGRFINADTLVSTGQGLLGNNMFAYCNNNPVNCYDPNGYELFLIIGGVKLTIDTLVLLAGCITALIAVISQLLRDLPKIAKAISQALEELFDALAVAVEKAKTKVQQWKKANHHIIARTAKRAEPARLIWTGRLGLGINDSRNLVPINQNLHYFVHTKQYYDMVNALVKLGYTKGRTGVLAVVKAIRTTFLVIDDWCF